MRKLPTVILWAVAFAYVESAVVEYLRGIYYPVVKGGFLFPLLTPEQLDAMGPEHWHRLVIELGRELATLVMLASVGIAAGKNRREAWAFFIISFGIWDIFYYLWLKLFLDWPESLMTWDLLFLVPVPWTSPVLAPLIVSLVMIGCGVIVLCREAQGRPLIAAWGDWGLIVAGGLTVVAAFCCDYRTVISGGVPRDFNWVLFFAGVILSSATFLSLLFRRA